MFGEDVRVDDWKIDLLCGGSQKAVSAPPGLTMVTLSADAKAAMEKRKTPIASFYANLLTFKGYYEAKWIPIHHAGQRHLRTSHCIWKTLKPIHRFWNATPK